MLVILFSGFYPSFSGCKDNLINAKLKVFLIFFPRKKKWRNFFIEIVLIIYKYLISNTQKKPHTMYGA